MKDKILVVDDEDSLRLTLKFRLADAGFDVRDAADGEQAIALLEVESADMVLLDINMPRMDGIETLGLIIQAHPSTDVVMLTGFADFSTAIDCLKKGAKDYLVKPIEVTELITRVRSILRARNAERSLGELQRRHNSVVLFEILPGLFSLQSSIDGLSRSKMTHDQELLLRQALSSAALLLEHTSGLVQCAQADTIPVDIVKADVDFGPLIQSIAERYEKEAASRGIQFQQKVGKNLPRLAIDTEKIGYALDLLVGGAFRLVEKKKKVQFSVSVLAAAEVLMELRVPFIYGGEEPGSLFPIFAEDANADPENKRKDLGFVIARRIAEEHGGKIWIDTSKVDEVLVSFALPVGETA
ncbi:MAG: response regulator [Ignavibacteriales bacterium]|nr:response regulator [Ignavibacteriales bacterium]